MTDRHSLTLDRELEGWILNQPLELRVVSNLATNGGIAAFYSVGASMAAFKLVAVQCGRLGNAYLGFLFWDVENSRDLLVWQKWTKDKQFDRLDGCGAIGLYYNLSLPKISFRDREWAWEAHSRVQFSQSAIKSGKPILGGRFLTNYFWLEDKSKLLA